MNLLPNKERENLKKGFKLRSLVLGSFLVSLFLLIGIILLLPAYFLARSNFSKVASGDYLSKTQEEIPTDEILNLPTEINSKLKFLSSNNNKISPTESITEIVERMSEEISLESISFVADRNVEGRKGVAILIFGKADNRESLVSFSTDLRESDLFTDVEIPVSNLTKDKDLPFSLDLFIENND